MDLPCGPGERVFALLDDAPKKWTWLDLSECIVSEILLSKDYPEPLFTAISYEKARYNTFWKSDFGKTIFTVDQYYDLPKEERVKKRGR